MAVRARINGKEHNEDIYIRRMLKAAIDAQKKHIENAAEFGDSELVMRAEHKYLAYLQGLARNDGKLSVAGVKPVT